jgi:hypothetical protein
LSSPTSAGINAEDAGRAMALPVLSSATNTNTSGRFDRLSASPSAATPCPSRAAIISLRLGNRSTSSPASGATTNSGTESARNRPASANPPAGLSTSIREINASALPNQVTPPPMQTRVRSRRSPC